MLTGHVGWVTTLAILPNGNLVINNNHDISVLKFPLKKMNVQAIQDLPPKLKEVSPQYQNLINQLDNYISRINGYGKKDKEKFQHGFWVMKKSRAGNRQANYKLAEYLRDQLQKGASMSEIFSQNNLFTLRQQYGATRNIHSSELKGIIRKAAK